MRIHRFQALATTLCLTLAAGATAQPDGQEPTFFDTVDVQIINVDVVVRDSNGRPVLDLTRDDFEILEDGQPVEITNFFAMNRGTARAAAQEDSLDRRQASDTPESAEDQQLHLLIFVDNLSLTPIARNRLLPEVRNFLERRMDSSQRVTVVVYDGTLDIRVPPTDRIEPVLTALDEAMNETGRGAQLDLEVRGLLRELDRMDYGTGNTAEDADQGISTVGTGEDLARRTYANIKQFAQNRHNETLRALRHVKEFVDSLTPLDGRKAVLFVSEGISVNPGHALLSAWERRFGGQIGTGLSRAGDTVELQTGALVQEMAEYASSRRVTFYGLGSGGIGLPKGATQTGFGGTTTAGGGPSWSSSFASILSDNRQESLAMLARTTGGLSASGLSGVRAALEQMMGDFENYYSLAYAPADQRDGKRHRVEVRLQDPELVVRHRESYRAKSVDEEMRDHIQSALLLGQRSNPLNVTLEFGDETEQEDGSYRVPVIVKIPIGRIVLLPQETHHQGQLSIFLAARDDKGRTSEIFKTEVPIRIPNDQVFSVLSRVGGFGMNLSIRPERHRIAVTVRDELGMAQSVATAEYEPGRLRVNLGSGPPASR